MRLPTIKTIFAITTIALPLFSVFSVDRDGRIERNPAGEATAHARAIELDPQGGSNLRGIEDSIESGGRSYHAIILNGGAQLHPSCLFEAQRAGKSEQVLRQTMNQRFARMLDAIISCRENYPEMSPYLDQSLSEYRRHVFRCEPPVGQEGLISIRGSGYGGYNNYLGTSTLTSNTFLSLLAPENKNMDIHSYGITALFHEILHSTSCNNRHDHDKIMPIPANAYIDRNTCDTNVTMDRVSVVESLCLGSDLVYSNGTASHLLARRMMLCGTDRGCRDMFTDAGNTVPWYRNLIMPNVSADLSNDQATRLCQRILDDGSCLQLRKTQGETITNSRPEVVALKRKMNERLLALIPQTTNQIPDGLWSLYPDLEQRFSALANTNCFRSQFNRNDGKLHGQGYLHLRTQSRFIPEAVNVFTRSTGPTLGRHLRGILDNLYESTNNFRSCSRDVQTREELQLVVTDLTQRLERDTSIDGSLLIINNLANNQFRFMGDASTRSPSSPLGRLLGEELTTEFNDVMDSLHYESPRFDCVRAGLTTFRAMEKSLAAPARRVPNSCPAQ